MGQYFMAVNLDKKECGYSVVYRRYTKIILRNIKKSRTRNKNGKDEIKNGIV